MDVFKFNNPNAPTKMEHGELINGLTSKMWVERYADNGEFTFIAPLRTNILKQLPLGTFVSHTNTKEIMIVENHEVVGDKNKEIQVSITGRSFETVLDERIVGSNHIFPVLEGEEYVLEEDHVWDQLVRLISDHVLEPNLKDPDDAIPYLSISQTVPVDTVDDPVARQLARGSLYEHVLKLLPVNNLGIKTVRPDGSSSNSSIVIHKGVDRTAEFSFSFSAGELDNIEFLYSRKPLKNSVLVSGTWVEVRVDGPEAGIDRKTMFINASEVDSAFELPPTGPNLLLVRDTLRKIGEHALAKQNMFTLKKAELSSQLAGFAYRKNYDLGDLIAVSGGYLVNSTDPTTMQIVEHVETEDETGQHAYPTLSMDYAYVPDEEPPPEYT